MCQIWNNYLLPKLSLATNNIGHTSTHSVSSWKYPSIISNIIYYYLQDLLPAMSRNIQILYINHWQTHCRWILPWHLNFIYKPLTITAVHCKYIASDKPTPPTVHQVLAMGTNECIAIRWTHKCREGYQELLLINLK